MRGDDDWLKRMSNTDIINLVDDWCHSERNRNIMKRRFVDGVSYEKLAYEFDMSVRQIENIIHSEVERLSAV